VRLGCE